MGLAQLWRPEVFQENSLFIVNLTRNALLLYGEERARAISEIHAAAEEMDPLMEAQEVVLIFWGVGIVPPGVSARVWRGV